MSRNDRGGPPPEKRERRPGQETAQLANSNRTSRTISATAHPAQSTDLVLGVTLRNFRALAKGALRGFATVELRFGLIFHDVAIFRGSNGSWASLPSKPLLNQDGYHRSGLNGKPKYAPVAEWRTRELADKFSKAVIKVVRAAHPDALDDGSKP